MALVLPCTATAHSAQVSVPAARAVAVAVVAPWGTRRQREAVSLSPVAAAAAGSLYLPSLAVPPVGMGLSRSLPPVARGIY